MCALCVGNGTWKKGLGNIQCDSSWYIRKRELCIKRKCELERLMILCASWKKGILCDCVELCKTVTCY